jgi:hypothetical protein
LPVWLGAKPKISASVFCFEQCHSGAWPNIIQTGFAPMSSGAFYLRDQASKCRAHAASMQRRMQCSVNWPTNTSFKRSKSKAKKTWSPLTAARPPSAGGIDQVFCCHDCFILPERGPLVLANFPVTTPSPDQANARAGGWRRWRSSNRPRSGSLCRALAAVATRLECVAQYWPPVPPRGHCQRRMEVFVSPQCFSTG